MSRAPASETPTPSINSSLSPFGVIDFVDNSCLSAAAATVPPPGAVVGGPPAYLEAHGIRYVPSASLDGPADCCGELPAGAVPMSRSAAVADSAPSRSVTQRDLESRVEDRVRSFLAARASDPDGLRGLREEIQSTRLRAERDFDYNERRDRINAAREHVRAAYASDGEEDLRSLKQKMEDDVAALRSGKLSASASSRVGKAREQLRGGRGVDF